MSLSRARVACAGDWMLRAAASGKSEGVRALPASLLDMLDGCDVVTANLEVVLSRRGDAVSKPSTVNLRCDPAIAMALPQFRVDAVSLANNHTMDFGPRALHDTISALKSASVGWFGAGATARAACEPWMANVGGTRLAVLGFSCTLPPASMALKTTPGVAGIRVLTDLELDPELMLEQPGSAPAVRTRAVVEDIQSAQEAVSQARKRVDVVLVHVHWGVVPAAMTSFVQSGRQGQAGGPASLADYQQPLGHALIDAGASVVIGHHPHVVHGIEVYREGLIAYSLGHFAFEALMWFMTPDGLLLDMDVDASGLRAVRVHPILLDRAGSPRNASVSERRRLMHHLARESAPFGTRFAPAERGALSVTLGDVAG